LEIVRRPINRFRRFCIEFGRTDVKTLGYCIALLMLLWSFVLWQVDNDRNRTIAGIVTANDKLALAFEDHTRQSLLRVDQTLRFIKNDFEANGTLTSSANRLIQSQINDLLINQSIVTDETGMPRTSALGGTNNLFGAPQFQAHIKTDSGKVFIGAPRKGVFSNKESIHISRRLNYPDGSFAGMVSVALNPDYFANFYQKMEMGTGHVVILTGLDGIIRASQHEGAVEPVSIELLFNSITKNQKGHYDSAAIQSGNPYYYSYRVLSDYPLVVQVGVSGEVALAEFQERRSIYVRGAFAVSSLILLYTALIIRGARKKRYSQARYRALVEQSFEALAVVDIETKEVVEVNHRFTEMLGYSLPEDSPLYVDRFDVDLERNEINTYAQLKTQRTLIPELRVCHHKNGVEVRTERAGSIINIDGREYYLVSMRDMTVERRRQVEMMHDAELARRVQRDLLPKLQESPLVDIRALYHPSNVVSGDSYHLEWRNKGTLLRGFLVDVSGHGLATAIQTASINSLLSENETAKLPLLGQVRRLNARAGKYFTDGAYAAMLGFELDLSLRELRYIGAGITQFYANGRKIETPGMFVGMWDEAEFIEGKITVAEGDSFCFLTDGFTDVLAKPEYVGFFSEKGSAFDADVNALEKLAKSGVLSDDGTGVCLKVKSLLLGERAGLV